jgi:hypothetical protein
MQRPQHGAVRKPPQETTHLNVDARNLVVWRPCTGYISDHDFRLIRRSTRGTVNNGGLAEYTVWHTEYSVRQLVDLIEHASFSMQITTVTAHQSRRTGCRPPCTSCSPTPSPERCCSKHITLDR